MDRADAAGPVDRPWTVASLGFAPDHSLPTGPWITAMILCLRPWVMGSNGPWGPRSSRSPLSTAPWTAAPLRCAPDHTVHSSTTTMGTSSKAAGFGGTDLKWAAPTVAVAMGQALSLVTFAPQ